MKPITSLLLLLLLIHHSFAQKTFEAEGIQYTADRLSKYYTFNADDPDWLIVIDSTLTFEDQHNHVVKTFFSDMEGITATTETILYKKTNDQDSLLRVYNNSILRSETQYRYDALGRLIKLHTKYLNEKPSLTKTIHKFYNLEADSLDIIEEQSNGQVTPEEYDRFVKNNLISMHESGYDSCGLLFETDIRNNANGRHTSRYEYLDTVINEKPVTYMEYYSDGEFTYRTVYDPASLKMPRHPDLNKTAEEVAQSRIEDGMQAPESYFTKKIKYSAFTVDEIQKTVSALSKHDKLSDLFRKNDSDLFYKYQNEDKSLQLSFQIESGIMGSYKMLNVYTSKDL